jgi:large subunit ribosomal protein L3
MKFLLGRKLEMTQRFRPDGTVIPVTRIKAGPMVVTQVKTADHDGYTSVQVGFVGKRRQSKSVLGHLKSLPGLRELREFRVDTTEKFTRGQTFTASVFATGDMVKVTGTSKGKGFAGVVKRHHFRGGPASHGHKDNLRMPGSIGSTAPQRVLKGLRMAGRMGGEQTTVANLEIVDIDPTADEILVSGAIPGARNGLILLVADGEMPEPQAKAEVAAEAPEAKLDEPAVTETAPAAEASASEPKTEGEDEKAKQGDNV